MSSYQFSHIVHTKPDFNSGKVYIWVWNADKTPPHLGFSCGKDYFSLTYKTSEHKSVSGMLGRSSRLKIPLVFIEIHTDVSLEAIANAFNKFPKAILHHTTCLTPIRELLGFDETIQQLAHLLTAIEKRGDDFQVFALHLDTTYKALPFYTLDTINERIHALNHAKR